MNKITNLTSSDRQLKISYHKLVSELKKCGIPISVMRSCDYNKVLTFSISDFNGLSA